MFKLTKKAETFKKFIIQHTEMRDYNLSEYESLEEAIEYEAQCANCSEEEMSKMIHEYSPEEVIDAAIGGHKWPIKLYLVEEYEELGSIDAELLKHLVLSVDENNIANGCEWMDWADGGEIIQQHAPDEWCDGVCWILDRAVESNGESLKDDLLMVERQLFGRNIRGSFYDR